MLQALGCNIFAGGFTLGVLDYFDVVAHLEHNNYGQNALNRNLPSIETLLPPWPNFNKIDFIYCNPPCSVWSQAGNGKTINWWDDIRLSCYNDSFNTILNEPKVLAIETVLASWRKAPEFFLEKSLRANDLGYHATILLHDGQYLKLPQVRRRMFLILSKVHLPWNTYTPYPKIPCDQALLNPPINTKNDVSASITEHAQFLLYNRTASDNTLLKVHDRLGYTSGRGSCRPIFISSCCKPGKPAPTLLHPMHPHPTEPRYLSINEMSRLTGFPDWWDWDVKGSVSAKASLIARGVTPPVGRWLAGFIHNALTENRAITVPRTEVIDILGGQTINQYEVRFDEN